MFTNTTKLMETSWRNLEKFAHDVEKVSLCHNTKIDSHVVSVD